MTEGRELSEPFRQCALTSRAGLRRNPSDAQPGSAAPQSRGVRRRVEAVSNGSNRGLYEQNPLFHCVGSEQETLGVH